MHIDLSGKTALVTGGSGSIGQAICVQLARSGADVAFTYMSDRDSAEQTLQKITGQGRRGFLIKSNFGDAKSTMSVVPSLREFTSTVDVLVSNAASGVIRPIGELLDRHWQWCMDINARALLRIVQGLTCAADDAPAFAPQGRIVAIGSLGALRAIPQYGAVGASKAALESLVRHLAYELGPQGITANVVSPGIIKTKALDHFPNREELLDVALRKTPVGRLARPEDVAQVVAFLCSEQAALISGQTIAVDGGYSSVA